MLYARREVFRGIEKKIGKAFAKIMPYPNAYTLFSLIPAVVTAFFIINKKFFLAAGFFFFAIFLDVIDGAVAKTLGKTSKLGAYLDTIVDRWVEIIVLFSLLFADFPSLLLPAYAWVFLLVVGSLMTTYAKAAAKEKEIVKNEVKGGLLERAERVFLLWFALILAGFNPFYSIVLISTLAVLSILSALQRILIVIRYSYSLLKQN